MGGKGTIWGTLVGALIIAVIRNGLTLLNAQSDIQYIVIGAVIILSVFIDVTRERMEAAARRKSAK
jgi:ribose transport system permease protein